MFFVRFCAKNYLTLNKPREPCARAIVLLRGKIFAYLFAYLHIL